MRALHKADNFSACCSDREELLLHWAIPLHQNMQISFEEGLVQAVSKERLIIVFQEVSMNSEREKSAFVSLHLLCLRQLVQSRSDAKNKSRKTVVGGIQKPAKEGKTHTNEGLAAGPCFDLRPKVTVVASFITRAPNAPSLTPSVHLSVHPAFLQATAANELWCGTHSSALQRLCCCQFHGQGEKRQELFQNQEGEGRDSLGRGWILVSLTCPKEPVPSFFYFWGLFQVYSCNTSKDTHRAPWSLCSRKYGYLPLAGLLMTHPAIGCNVHSGCNPK